jgi:hypothetical protein
MPVGDDVALGASGRHPKPFTKKAALAGSCCYAIVSTIRKRASPRIIRA